MSDNKLSRVCAFTPLLSSSATAAWVGASPITFCSGSWLASLTNWISSMLDSSIVDLPVPAKPWMATKLSLVVEIRVMASFCPWVKRGLVSRKVCTCLEVAKGWCLPLPSSMFCKIRFSVSSAACVVQRVPSVYSAERVSLRFPSSVSICSLVIEPPASSKA